MTIKCGLFVRLEAKTGEEQAVTDFLAAGLADQHGGRGGYREDRGYERCARI